MIHELKTWPEYFSAILSGVKTFEFRENDRGFMQGDLVILKEFKPTPPTLPFDYGPHPGGEYTGREIKKTIGYVMQFRRYAIFTLLPYGE